MAVASGRRKRTLISIRGDAWRSGAYGLPSYLHVIVSTRRKRRQKHVPDTRYADHGLVEVGVRLNALRRVQHGLACALRLGLRDGPAVAVHDGFFGGARARGGEQPASTCLEAIAASEQRRRGRHRRSVWRWLEDAKQFQCRDSCPRRVTAVMSRCYGRITVRLFAASTTFVRSARAGRGEMFVLFGHRVSAVYLVQSAALRVGPTWGIRRTEALCPWE